MPLQHASIMMPGSRLEDLPTYLRGSAAADLLAAWTALWHPALIHATGNLSGWHSAAEPPEPETLAGELVLVPSVSRDRLAPDWCSRLRATGPLNPPPVESRASRAETIAAALDAAGLTVDSASPELAGDFVALGYAHLQVELLTRAMRYTTVLDADEFRDAVIRAARATIAHDDEHARDELTRAFDLLADARNHFYGVDFYLVDVTLVAESTLGEPLRKKVATGPPTNLLITAELVERVATEQPLTLADIKRGIAAEQVCVLGGPLSETSLAQRAPEGILSELQTGGHIFQRILAERPEVYGQFGGSFSPLLPQALRGLGFRGALYVAFDGGLSQRSPQPKTRWGEQGGPAIDILSAVPLDTAEPGTWLTFGERIADTLVRDHVATVLLAGWPGQESEYYDDLRRIAAYGGVLGKFVTLQEYFRLTAETDDWATFHTQTYANPLPTASVTNPISSRVNNYRQHVAETFDRLTAGLAAVVQSTAAVDSHSEAHAVEVALNPWSFASSRYTGFDPVDFGLRISDCGLAQTQSAIRNPKSEIGCLPEVPAWGFATIKNEQSNLPAVVISGRTLRNEFFEVVISEATGGIQSLRAHRDRGTRISQRLVMHDRRLPRGPQPNEGEPPRLDVRMQADQIETTRSETLVGQITANGRLIDAAGQLLARFSQTTRLVSGLPAVIVDVELKPELPAEGVPWESYFASRLAWRDEAVTLRKGVDWTARETGRARIDSLEWVEVSDGVGSVTCFAGGLPYHRRAGPTWLDTLLAVAGETRPEGQFAIGLDCRDPTQTALALLTAGRPSITNLPSRPPSPSGWLLHLGAKHAIVTHLISLPAPRSGICVRLLETEGRTVRTSLTAFRPFHAARRTDFRGEAAEPLPVIDGRVRLEFGPHEWLQVEAEW